jgi:hypothetical protein
MRLALFVVLASSLAGCIDDLDPRWTLSHDHVVAVRASLPGVMPGEAALLDALVAHDDGPTTLEEPLQAEALLAPISLSGVVYTDGGRWYVGGPPEETLAVARVDLGLPEGAPIPLDVYAAFDRPGGDPMYAKKRVWLGKTLRNPPQPTASMDGSVMPDIETEGPRAGLAPEIVVPKKTDVYFATTVAADWRTNWLSSCGTLFQDDVATSFLRVDDGDSADGELAVVVRDPDGGVAWRVWPIHSE